MREANKTVKYTNSTDVNKNICNEPTKMNQKYNSKLTHTNNRQITNNYSCNNNEI